MNHTSKLKLFSPKPIALHLGVWQISDHPTQGKPEPLGVTGDPLDASQSSWVVTTARSAKVFVLRGLSLQHLLQASLRASGMGWSLQDATSTLQDATSPLQHATSTLQDATSPKPPIRLSLFLPDHHFHTFQMTCMPQWGRQDIEAESRLEAARLMRCPLESLNLDFEVEATPGGAMMANVMACQSSLAQAASAMFDKLGFKLNSLTCHSDLKAYAHSWNVPPDLLKPMVYGTAATC